MYDDLVRRLREVTDEVDSDYDVDPYNAEQRCLAILQAADALEKHLSRLQNAINWTSVEKDYKDLCAYLPKWIPVTERLPEDLTRVIVFCEDGVSYGLCEHLIADDEEVVEWHDFLHHPINPTHWMPLPTPPKEE